MDSPYHEGHSRLRFWKVCHITVRMADWRNLPPRLTNIGEVTATLNYAPENEDEDFDNL